jgi:predicted nucleic acid-binding protein
MIAVDTSVAVALFGEWHEFNARAREILDEGAVLPAHALLETYSVLTSFPPPHRAPPDVVSTWLENRFEAILPSPGVDEQRALVRRLTSLGRAGGAVYDALVGLTAQLAGATLVTADRRAEPIYDALNVSYERL